MQLRQYQQSAIDTVWNYLREQTGNPVVVLPTGSGKTPVLVALAREAVEQWSGRVLILAHVKELLAQAREKFLQWWPFAPVGIYSAGLRKRDTDDQIIIAGIQSVHNKADKLGRFDLVIIDEAHLVPAAGDGMYRSLINDLRVINPHLRIVGLTATPYRLDSGLIYGGANVLSAVCYDANVKTLIDQGFLCHLRGKAGHEADLSGVHSRGGDYIPGELESALTDEETVSQAVDEIQKYAADRKALVIFCAGVKHAGLVSDEMVKRAIACRVVTGETPNSERDDFIRQFKDGELRALLNINVLSIGFDAPHIDCVVMLRPTQSAGLYYQQVGRGLRLHPGKTDCLVLDLAGNIRRHGPIDMIEADQNKREKGTGDAPVKVCPECAEVVPAAARICPACSFAFPPPPIAKHETKADVVEPLSKPAIEEVRTVQSVDYIPWEKKGAPPGHPKTLRVVYTCGEGNIQTEISEWVCFEHVGYARDKAERWWSDRSSAPCPDTVAEAQAFILSTANAFKEPASVRVRFQQGKFPELIGTVFAKPCEACLHYDGGYCHKWEQDVPVAYRAAGCDQFQVMQQATAAKFQSAAAIAALCDDSSEPPF